MLCNDLPCNPIVYAVLEQHGFVDSVGVTEIRVATISLRKTSNLQNKHYFAGGRREGKSKRKDDSKESELIHDLQPEQKNYPNTGSYTYTHTHKKTHTHKITYTKAKQ